MHKLSPVWCALLGLAVSAGSVADGLASTPALPAAVDSTIAPIRALLNQERPVEAESLATAALARNQASGRSGTRADARLRDALADCWIRQGKSGKKELAFAEQTVALKRKLFGPKSVEYAQSLDRWSGLLWFAGEG